MEFKIWEENMNKVERKLMSLQKKCQKAEVDFHYARKGEVLNP